MILETLHTIMLVPTPIGSISDSETISSCVVDSISQVLKIISYVEGSR